MSLYAPLDYLRAGLAEQEKLAIETQGRISDLEKKLDAEHEYMKRRRDSIAFLQASIQREIKQRPPTNVDHLRGKE